MSNGPQFSDFTDNVQTTPSSGFSTQYYIFGGIAILIVLVLILLYYFYYNKSATQKNEKNEKNEPPNSKEQPVQNNQVAEPEPVKKVRFEGLAETKNSESSKIPENPKKERPEPKIVEIEEEPQKKESSSPHDNVKVEPNLDELEKYAKL